MQIDTAVVTVTLSEESLAKVKATFPTVHYYPAQDVPHEVLGDVQIWLSEGSGIPASISIEQLPNLKLIQAISAGIKKVVDCNALKTQKARKQVTICSASGIHGYSIPSYVAAMVMNVYMRLGQQLSYTKGKAHWPSRPEMLLDRFGTKTNMALPVIYGKTVGMLGYGHIAREAARLLKAFNLNIIAANSTGKQTVDEGYIVPGTGDKDGSIPSAYYTTTGPSFDEFLSKTDILICSLPSTKSTVRLLTADQFRKLRPGAIFINVGRGDIVVTDDLLTVLDEELYGAALDVTDPEPLPDGHPLFLHPRVIITPHCSGDFVGYNDAATELFLANAERLRKGEKPYNIADAERGY